MCVGEQNGRYLVPLTGDGVCISRMTIFKFDQRHVFCVLSFLRIKHRSLNMDLVWKR
jgi:hypothetical protein